MSDMISGRGRKCRLYLAADFGQDGLDLSVDHGPDLAGLGHAGDLRRQVAPQAGQRWLEVRQDSEDLRLGRGPVDQRALLAQSRQPGLVGVFPGAVGAGLLVLLSSATVCAATPLPGSPDGRRAESRRAPYSAWAIIRSSLPSSRSAQTSTLMHDAPLRGSNRTRTYSMRSPGASHVICSKSLNHFPG